MCHVRHGEDSATVARETGKGEEAPAHERGERAVFFVETLKKADDANSHPSFFSSTKPMAITLTAAAEAAVADPAATPAALAAAAGEAGGAAALVDALDSALTSGDGAQRAAATRLLAKVCA